MDDELSNNEVSPHVAKQIDRGLKLVFDRLASEELPDTLKDLLEQLKEDSQNKDGAGE